MRSRRWVFIVIALFALYLASWIVLLPLYSIGPGPARDVAPLIRINGEPVYQSSGDFVMTSVHVVQLTPFGAFLAWLDPDETVVGRSTLYAPGETDRQEQRRAISQMDQSKLDAAYVVLHELLGYPKDHGEGILIESVVPGCAADGELYPGDLVRSIDGTTVSSVTAASKLIRSVASGSTLTFDLTVDGEPQVVQLVRRPCGGSKQPLVGVSMIPNFPFSISISSGDVGGPSAGLMWAVTMYDLLTPDDLTGGRTIAGTGVIEPSGRVDPIGGIAEKIIAAKDAGADVLLLPRGNLAEARAAGVGGIRLVPVSSFDDALLWLRANG